MTKNEKMVANALSTPIRRGEDRKIEKRIELIEERRKRKSENKGRFNDYEMRMR